MEPIKRFELIELQVPPNSLGRVGFSQAIPQLQNQPDQIIYIKAIRIYTITSYANSQQTNSIPGFPVADIPKACLTLYVDGNESIKTFPLVELINVNDHAGPYLEIPLWFDNLQNVSFDKSYVSFSSASDNALYVIPLGIIYTRFMKSASGVATTSPTPPGNWIEG